MPTLFESFRPKSWDELVGQPDALDQINQIRNRGLAGRAYWIAGRSGTGKTTIARLIAAEVADPWAIIEYDDPSQCTAAELEQILRGYRQRVIGRGACYILNEAHTLRKDQVPKLLGVTERVPSWVTWVFTTTVEGEQLLFDKSIDADPLLSRCQKITLNTRDLAIPFAIRAREIAQAENLDGQSLDAYVALVKRHKLNFRAVLQEIESGAMCKR